MLMMVQPGFGPVIGPVVAVLLMALVLYLFRDELREVYAQMPPERQRLSVGAIVALCMAVVMAVPVYAQDVLIKECQWSYLLEQCNGYESCAWALWLSFGCWVIPG